MLAFMDLLPKTWLRDLNKQEMKVELTNGSTAYFRSLDSADLGRGPNLAFIHIDEAGYTNKDAWTTLLGSLRQTGYPLQAWATSTPVKHNWLYEVWVRDATPQHVLYQARSSDNPFLPPDFEDFAKGKGDNYWQQEVMGQFVGGEGLVYPSFDRTRHLAAPPEGIRPRRTIAGVDWGFRDPSVIVVLQDYGEYGLYVPEVFCEVGRTVDEHAAVAERLARQYKIDRFYCDPSRPDSIESFRRRGISAVPANNDILVGIQEVTTRLNGRHDAPEIHFNPGLEPLIYEMEVYQYPEHTNQSRNAGEKPVDKDNHILDALRYACMTLSGGEPPLLLHYRKANQTLVTPPPVVVPTPAPVTLEQVAEQLVDRLMTGAS